jgi:hypothetical protein
MEFHASGLNGQVVEIMACSDTMCRQLKVTLSEEQAKEADIQSKSSLFCFICFYLEELL